MEPEVREFLIKIVQSISMGLLWLLSNMTFGIYFGYAFFEGVPTSGNIVYYICFLFTFILLVKYLRKKWKGWEETNY